MKPYKLNDYKNLLIHGKADFYSIVGNILEKGTYEDIMAYYAYTPVLMKGIFKYRLSYLIRKSYRDIYYKGDGYLKNPQDYVGLMAFIFPLFKDRINKFVKNRILFENAYLNGEYDVCLEVLDRIDREISYSVWGATNRIRIAELQEGDEGRTRVFNEVRSESLGVIFIEICSTARDTASIEASTLLWYEQKYKSDVMSYAPVPWQKDFIVSHLYPYKNYMAGEWMSFDMLSSLVDLYVNFIYNLRLIVPLCFGNSKIYSYLSKILASIDDPYLEGYCGQIGLNRRNANSERDSLLSHLYFNHSAHIEREKAERYIEENPIDIDYLLEYIKCLVDANETTNYGKEHGSILERIKYHLFLYLKRNNPSLHLNRLNIICQANPSLVAFRQLNLLMNNLENGKIEDFALSNWCYSFGENILDACFYDSAQKRKEYISKRWSELNETTIDSQNIRIILYLLALFPSNPPISTSQLELLVNKRMIPPYLLGMVVSHLIDANLNQGNYGKVVELYVGNMMECPSLNISVNKSKIFETFSRDVDMEINNPLDLSLFYSMLDAKPGKIQANAYRYLTSMGVDRPSKLSVDPTNERQIYYLEKVVDRNILDLFPLVFIGPSDSIEERLKICQMLRLVNNKREYTIEISELAKELGILKMLKEVDASKIDVDENMLKKHEMKQGRELFRLYQYTSEKIETYTEEQLLSDMFKTNENEEREHAEGKRNLEKVPYKYLQLARFYLYVRDQFLLNDKAGLDYFMSSRIRHGTIVNQLRHHFQELHLTTRKNDYGQYEMNTYWSDEVLKLSGPENVKCQEAFLSFTQNLDAVIYRLKNEYVQVKTEDNNLSIDACFDFSRNLFTQKIWSLYDAQIEDYYSCVDAVFNDMWERADVCFVQMKQTLGQVEVEMKSLIDTLKKEVCELIGADNAALPFFNDTITRCKTYLHEDFISIAGWFQRKQSSGYDFTIQQLVDASLESIKKINTVDIKCKQNISSYSILTSRCLNVFYDLFYNLLVNVVEHAESKNNCVECKMEVTEEHDMLRIYLTNAISKAEKDVAMQKIAEYEEFITHRESNAKNSMSRSEGRSGIYKTDTIVYYQLKADRNRYKPTIEGDLYNVEILINIQNLRVKNEDSLD